MGAGMTWRERTVVAILLLVARIVAGDDKVRHDLNTLATNISVNGAKP
jgi:hypothetical protein